MGLIVEYVVSATRGVRILVWAPRNAQCLSCDRAEVTFKSDLFSKLSRPGDKLNTRVEGLTGVRDRAEGQASEGLPV